MLPGSDYNKCMKTKTSSENQSEHYQANRREVYGLDDKYVEAYCNDPVGGKTKALITAGYAGSNINQEAYRMHKRLATRIRDRTTELINGLDTLAANQLEAILQTDIKEVGYANMNRSIQQALEFAGRKDNTVIIKQETMSSDERQEAIQVLQDRLKLEQKDITIN